MKNRLLLAGVGITVVHFVFVIAYVVLQKN